MSEWEFLVDTEKIRRTLYKRAVNEDVRLIDKLMEDGKYDRGAKTWLADFEQWLNANWERI